MRSRILLVFVCLTSLSTIADARMYKWVDADGVTQYTQSPPPSGHSKLIAPPPIPSATRKLNESTKEEANTDTKESSEEDNKVGSPTPEEIAKSEAIRKENCEISRTNLTIYTNLGRRLIKTPDGLYKRPTEEERQAEISKHEDGVKEFCRE